MVTRVAADCKYFVKFKPQGRQLTEVAAKDFKL
jgi:hypothetical protein